MKTIYKINSLFVLVVAMLFVSCEEEITRDPSPATNPSSNKVYFPTQDNNVILGVDDSSFEVKIAREVTTSALTVNLKPSTVYDNFTLPSSISFEAGEAEKFFTVAVADLDFFKKISLSIEVADADQTDPYTTGTKYPIIALSVIKDDFAPYADGIHYSDWWEESEPALLEYSVISDSYRFKEWQYPDELVFQWDGGSTITLPGTSSYFRINTGDVHPTYGVVYADFYRASGAAIYDDSDPDAPYFAFYIRWTVAAGTFGSSYDYFDITHVY